MFYSNDRAMYIERSTMWIIHSWKCFEMEILNICIQKIQLVSAKPGWEVNISWIRKSMAYILILAKVFIQCLRCPGHVFACVEIMHYYNAIIKPPEILSYPSLTAIPKVFICIHSLLQFSLLAFSFPPIFSLICCSHRELILQLLA